MDLTKHTQLFVQQVHELGEWLGFETRNKYAIFDAQKIRLGYAAEQGKGALGFLFRQYLGHWRTFEVHFFNEQRELVFVAHHPFRWFFSRIEVFDAERKKNWSNPKAFFIFY